MEDLKAIINFCISLLNTRLTFSPFSFTIMQYILGSACLGVVIGFFKSLFDS